MRLLPLVGMALVLAGASPALSQVQPTQGANQCFARSAGLTAMQGFDAAAQAGNALNASADDSARRSALAEYDRQLANAIAAMGSRANIAEQLIKLDSIVDRVGACAAQIGLAPDRVGAADRALTDRIAANAARLDPGAPGLKPTPEQLKIQHQILNSARFKRVLADNGGGAKLVAAEADIQRRKEADALRAREYSARMEVEEAERRTRYQAEAAAQLAYFRRQETAEAAPDAVMVRRALIGDMRATFGNTTGMGFARGLAAMTERPGESMISEYWGYNDGVAELRFGRAPDDRYLRISYDVSKVACTPVAGRPANYTCSFMIGGKLFDRFGPMLLVDQTRAAVPLKTRIVWDGGRWSAPEIKAKMSRAIAATAVAPSASASGSGQSSLCRSLNAGVAAAGGRSTSSAFDPQTWGC